ncbi:MAG TPA: FAD-dependent oxidoreductase [Nitrososphaerales archaeon]|nr:FAD-dependent oxidoreductase [Nitrososphaerales archaeon]
MEEPYDVVVVGGSAAGLTAAMYSARQGLKTLVVTKDIGGQMLLTNEIQNYPGYESISGFELSNKLKEQAELYGAEFVYEEVTGVEEDKECPGLCFTVRTAGGKYTGTAVILAFGKTPRNLGVPGERELNGKGVSYCAVCDGPLFKEKTVTVVGTGDQALDAVNYLANVVKFVYLVHQYDKPIGSEDYISQVLKSPNVKTVPNSRVVELRGDGKLQSVIIENTLSRQTTELESDGIFVEIGYVAKTGIVEQLVRLNGREIAVDRVGVTSTPGIFAAGDVTDNSFKQAVISAAQGASAALSAYNYVQRTRGKTAAKADWRSVKPVIRAGGR